jgi:outer membrane protein
MLRSLSLVTLSVWAAGLVFGPVALGQGKIGVIDLQRALLETGEIKKASDALQAKYKPRQDQLAKLQQELGDLQTQLNASQGKLSPSGQADLEAQAQRKQRQAQRLSDDLQADVDRERNTILQQAGTRMTEIVKKIAEAQGFDLVIDVSNRVYHKPALEVTDQAIAQYDKTYPVK